MRSAAEPTSNASSCPLIGPSDPPPFTLFNPGGAAPLLFVCDHASRAFPRALGSLGLASEVARRHIAWDIGAADLARELAHRFDAPAVLAGYSRLVIDCNRAPTDTTSIATESDGQVIPGNASLDAEGRKLRVQCFFEPYHAAIAARLAQFRRAAVVPAFLSIHSFTPVMNGTPRPWHVGVLWDRDARIAGPLLEGLRARPELCVGDNLPYSGRHPADHTVALHAESAGLPHVCIEVRQDLIDAPAGVERWGRILGETLAPVLKR